MNQAKRVSTFLSTENFEDFLFSGSIKPVDEGPGSVMSGAYSYTGVDGNLYKGNTDL